MAITLPTNADGSLRPFNDTEIEQMDIRRRGVRQSDHARYRQGPDGSTCTRKFSCVWDQRFNAAIYFVGASKQYANATSGKDQVSRLLPQIDPDQTNWVCTNVAFEPFHFDGTVDAKVTGSEPYPGYNRCELEATFELVPFTILDDAITGLDETQRYVTRPGLPGADIRAEPQYVGLPGSSLVYVTDDGTSKPKGVAIQYPVGFVETKQTLQIIWRRVPFSSWGEGTALTNRVIGKPAIAGPPLVPAVPAYLGSVNLTKFFGYPPLSLLLLGVEQKAVPDATGLGYSWDITYVFQHKPVIQGQLGYYYHDTSDAATFSGYYQVLRKKAALDAGFVTRTPAQIAANDVASLYRAREFKNLFNVDAVEF